MYLHRYIVVNMHEGWKIVRGSPRACEPFSTKREAVCAAVDFAESEGFAEAEVVVRQEDGYFATMRVHRNTRPANAGGRRRDDERKSDA